MAINKLYSIIAFIIIVIIAIILSWPDLSPSFAPGDDSLPLNEEVNLTKPSNAVLEIEREPYSGTLSASIFVPYWMIPDGNVNLPNISNLSLDNIIYFGITPNDAGIDNQETGHTRIGSFMDATSNFEGNRLLTLRMSNEDINIQILRDSALQKVVISETVAEAQNDGFDGIVLDLEHSVIPTTDTTDSITDFVVALRTKAQEAGLSFCIAVFGDIYYRARPYDIASISQNVDHIYIMAYDFHKSLGEPGPNFPLFAGETYPYSLEVMLNQFLADVSLDKISVLFGMFGYDWSVDDENRPLKAAVPFTLNQIKSQYFPTCSYTNCQIKENPSTRETNITYSDESGQKHTLWYEDEQSIEKKINYLRSQGISQIGFWAYGYY